MFDRIRFSHRIDLLKDELNGVVLLRDASNSTLGFLRAPRIALGERRLSIRGLIDKLLFAKYREISC